MRKQLLWRNIYMRKTAKGSHLPTSVAGDDEASFFAILPLLLAALGFSDSFEARNPRGPVF